MRGPMDGDETLRQTPGEADFLERMYAQIPAFKCIEGCVDCCGPIPFSILEMGRAMRASPLKNPIAAVNALMAGSSHTKCVYASAGCEIYPVRPAVCRLFGTSEDPMLTCPHGRRPEKLFTREETLELHGGYHRLIFEEQARFLEGEV